MSRWLNKRQPVHEGAVQNQLPQQQYSIALVRTLRCEATLAVAGSVAGFAGSANDKAVICPHSLIPGRQSPSIKPSFSFKSNLGQFVSTWPLIKLHDTF